MKEDLKELIQRNGLLFTVFTVVLIIGVGVTLIDNPDKWWISLLAITAYGVIIFLFLNARVIIKATISIVLLLFESIAAFKLGATVDTTGLSGSIWMLTIFITFFALLTISYLIPSRSSRWGVLSMSMLIGFISTYTIAGANVNLTLSSVIGMIIAFTVFFIWYKFGFRLRSVDKDMPNIYTSEKFVNGITDTLLPRHYGVLPYEKKKETRSVLVWDDDKAYSIALLNLTQKFGVAGKRKQYLSYKGKAIHPWLLNKAYQSIPLWKIGNAEVMLVLLDVNNTNGNQAKVIGLQVPDSKRKIPVGVFPAKFYLQKNNYEKLMKEIVKEFGEYTDNLTEKQRNHLDKKLPEFEIVEEAIA